MDKILYVGRIGLPEDAPGIRVYNIAKILRDIGYETVFFCDKILSNNKHRMLYDNFEYFFNEPVNLKGKLLSTYRIYELLTANKMFKRIKEYCEKVDKPFAIILYNDLYPLTKKLISFCNKNEIKLIMDSTEWYEKVKSKQLVNKIVPYLTDKRIKRLDKKVNNIISISSYFTDYYEKLGCKVVEIPPVFEVENNYNLIKKYNYYSEHVVNLVYAGKPSRSKDILDSALKATLSFNQTKIKIRLDVVGVDHKYVKGKLGDIEFEKYGVFIHGKLPHKDTLDIVRKADFGVLLRFEKRYAKAGFSTKFSECMSNGVSMICNEIGGTDKLLTNGVDGFVIKDASTDSLVEVFEYVTDLGEEKITTIKKAALNTAYNKLNREFYNREMIIFLEDKH